MFHVVVHLSILVQTHEIAICFSKDIHYYRDHNKITWSGQQKIDGVFEIASTVGFSSEGVHYNLCISSLRMKRR